MTTQHLTVHPPLAPGLQIGVMTPEEIATLAQWARLEGWNPGHHDLNIAAGYDPEAFIALRQDGALVGGGSILSWRGAAGFMGLFILRPDARGRGWGGQLWHARLQRLRARLSPGAPIGMDGVKAMAPFYARGGFRPLHEDWRYAGCAQGERDPQMISIEQVPMLQLASLLGLIPGQPVQVDIPEPHTAAARILERLGLRPTFSCVRMVQGDDRPLPLTRIFGLTSFEFG
jgi:GNAT superfamily N-acetyltransferase